jgi:hypothetical protein
MTHDQDERGEPIYIDARGRCWRPAAVSLIGRGMVMDLLTVMWWPTKEPFRFDVPAIVTKMNNVFPKREYTEEGLREHQEELRTFFVL